MEQKRFVSTSISDEIHKISSQNSQESTEFVVQSKHRVNYGKANHNHDNHDQAEIPKSVFSQKRQAFENEKLTKLIKSYNNKSKMRRSFGDLVYFSFKANDLGASVQEPNFPYEQFLQKTKEGKPVFKEKEPEEIDFANVSYREEKEKRMILSSSTKHNEENQSPKLSRALKNAPASLGKTNPDTEKLPVKRVLKLCNTKKSRLVTPEKNSRSLSSRGSAFTTQKCQRSSPTKDLNSEFKREIRFVSTKRKHLGF